MKMRQLVFEFSSQLRTAIALSMQAKEKTTYSRHDLIKEAPRHLWQESSRHDKLVQFSQLAVL